MNHKPKTRVEASAPRATAHLSELHKKAMDLQADTEHTDGSERERLTRQIEKLGGSAIKPLKGEEWTADEGIPSN